MDYLLKANPSGCPNRSGNRDRFREWQDGQFTGDIRLIKDDAQPKPGDKVVIWVNENPQKERPAPEDKGRGLSCFAEVVDFALNEIQWTLRITKLEPILPPVGMKEAKSLAPHSQIVNTLADSRHGRLIELTADARADLENVVARKRLQLEEYRRAEAVGKQPPSFELNPGEASAERERVYSLIERRMNQGPFREAVIKRDGLRCAITGTEIPEVLEAAHLVPFSSGDPKRDDPSNGILLRADIHTLFDRGLMAINPEDRKLWISPSLEASPYAQYRERAITAGAGNSNLADHFNWTRAEGSKAQNESRAGLTGP